MKSLYFIVDEVKGIHGALQSQVDGQIYIFTISPINRQLWLNTWTP